MDAILQFAALPRWHRWGLAGLVVVLAVWAHTSAPESYAILVPAALIVAALAYEITALILCAAMLYGTWLLIAMLPIPAAIVLGAIVIAIAILRRR